MLNDRHNYLLDTLYFCEKILIEISESLPEEETIFQDKKARYRFWGYLTNYVNALVEDEDIRPFIFKLKDFEHFRYHSPDVRKEIKNLFDILENDFKGIKSKLKEKQKEDFQNSLNFQRYCFDIGFSETSQKDTYENYFQQLISVQFPEKFKIYGQPINTYYEEIFDAYLNLREDIFKKYEIQRFEIDNHSLKIIHSLKDYFSFELEFNGTLSVIKILYAYNLLHPSKEIPIDVYFYDGLEPVFGIEKIHKNDIQELVNHIRYLTFLVKQHLSDGLIKEHIVLKFRTLCELYKKDEYSNEAEKDEIASAEIFFQDRFNEFIFQNGYYPITEAQLNSGRLDTLAISEKRYLLYELKQIGFKSSKVTASNVNSSIKSAKTQLINYHNRLFPIPYINENVFIIIFSKMPILIEEPIQKENGLIFHIVIVDFSQYKDSEKSKYAITV